MAESLPSTAPNIAGYRYLRPLGVGGFADVYLYEQDMPRRQVAIKVLHRDVVDELMVRMFTSEADAMANLSTHPSILTIYQASVSADGRPYLVLEYCPDSVGEHYRDNPMTAPEVLDLGIKIASALETAHRRGILHRDIKPSNLLLNEYGLPVLSDFGIVGSVAGGDDPLAGLSLPWSAPEVVNEDTFGDVQTEIWSLGATLYALLAGRSPFEVPLRGQNSSAKLRSRILKGTYTPIDRNDVPTELQHVLAKTMAKDRRVRYRSMFSLASDLQAIQRRSGLAVTEIEIPNVASHDPEGADPSPWQAPGLEDTVGPVRSVVPVTSDRPQPTRSGIDAYTRTRQPEIPEHSGGISKAALAAIVGSTIVATAVVVYLVMTWMGG